MKKLFSKPLTLALLAILLHIQGACAKTQYKPEQEPSVTPSATIAQNSSATTGVYINPKINIDIDKSLITPPFKPANFDNVPDCIFYYKNADSVQGGILYTRIQAETKEKDLERRLKIYIKKYSDTLNGADITMQEPTYSNVAGYPAAEFKTEQGAGENALITKTLLIATESELYCLTIQDTANNFNKNTELFEKLEDSAKAVEAE